MDAAIERFRHFRIDRCAETGQTAERCLDVATGAAKPVVEIEMTESSIEVIKPHQANDTAAEPNAFRIASGAIDGLCGFRKLIGLALTVLGGIRR